MKKHVRLKGTGVFLGVQRVVSFKGATHWF